MNYQDQQNLQNQYNQAKNEMAQLHQQNEGLKQQLLYVGGNVAAKQQIETQQINVVNRFNQLQQFVQNVEAEFAKYGLSLNGNNMGGGMTTAYPVANNNPVGVMTNTPFTGINTAVDTGVTTTVGDNDRFSSRRKTNDNIIKPAVAGMGQMTQEVAIQEPVKVQPTPAVGHEYGFVLAPGLIEEVVNSGNTFSRNIVGFNDEDKELTVHDSDNLELDKYCVINGDLDVDLISSSLVKSSKMVVEPLNIDGKKTLSVDEFISLGTTSLNAASTSAQVEKLDKLLTNRFNTRVPYISGRELTIDSIYSDKQELVNQYIPALEDKAQAQAIKKVLAGLDGDIGIAIEPMTKEISEDTPNKDKYEVTDIKYCELTITVSVPALTIINEDVIDALTTPDTKAMKLTHTSYPAFYDALNKQFKDNKFFKESLSMKLVYETANGTVSLDVYRTNRNDFIIVK